MRNPRDPASGCYSDVKWSERDARYMMMMMMMMMILMMIMMMKVLVVFGLFRVSGH